MITERDIVNDWVDRLLDCRAMKTCCRATILAAGLYFAAHFLGVIP